MATKLHGALKRELRVGGKPYMLTVTTDGFRIVPKGRRKGRELAWKDIVSGEAALAVALNASLATPMQPAASARRRRGADGGARRPRGPNRSR